MLKNQVDSPWYYCYTRIMEFNFSHIRTYVLFPKVDCGYRSSIVCENGECCGHRLRNSRRRTGDCFRNLNGRPPISDQKNRTSNGHLRRFMGTDHSMGQGYLICFKPITASGSRKHQGRRCNGLLFKYSNYWRRIL